MKRIAIFTDIHGNIDALKSLYTDIKQEGINEIYHLGDAIAIGPEPKTTIDFLCEKNIVMLKGNHEIYYTDIVTKGTTDVHEAELNHQKWVAQEMGDSYYDLINALDYECLLEIEGVKILLCHYPYTLKNGKFNWFVSLEKKIKQSDFGYKDADLYIYGHQHNGSDKKIDGVRFINLKSAGATKEEYTSYLIIEISDGKYEVIYKSVPYDRDEVIKKLDRYEVPERKFIKKAFFGRE
jgi:predicted phosphodiesterase